MLGSFKYIAVFLLLLFPNLILWSCQEKTTIEEITVGADIPLTNFAPDNYSLTVRDDFSSFNTTNWSKGLTYDTDPSIKIIWNRNTGGENLLNNNYAGYLADENVNIMNGHLYLNNRKEIVQGTDPVGIFDYTTGWINSLQKINFNGSQKSMYLEIKAKFPRGNKVWPAIWLIDDSEVRSWPP